MTRLAEFSLRARVAGVAILLLGAVPATAQQMYKWVDSTGKVQYTDTPPPANAKGVEQRRFGGNVIETNEATFASRDAQKRYPVTLWINDCGEPCGTARALLVKRGITFSERNPAATPDEEAAFKKITGGEMKVPYLVVGSLRKIQGLQEDDWHAALDAAGYPRTAPAGYKPPARPVATAAPSAPPAVGQQAGTPEPSATPR
jgi:hypothetical protein